MNQTGLSELQFLCAMGADEAIGDQPVGLYRFGNFKPKTELAVKPLSQPPIASGAFDAKTLADAAHDLPALRGAIESFSGIEYKSAATQTVFADGNPNATVMFIGEAPGAEEDKQGLPFVGPAGQLLNKMLAAIQLRREDVYITNILPWRPPGNRTPTIAEMQLCLPFVQKHIALVAPKILVCLGGVALKSLFGKDGIMKMRGQWLDYKPHDGQAAIPALVTYHPAFLLRTPAYKKDAWTDLQALQKRIGQLS